MNTKTLTPQQLRQMAPDDPDVLYLASKVYMNLWNGAFQRLLARHAGSYQVRLIVAEHTEGRQFGFLGEPGVNVLLLNLALDERKPMNKSTTTR